MSASANGCSDYSIPPSGFVFPFDEDYIGRRLALIFGNEAGGCPFYGKQCLFCEMGAGEYNGHRFECEENIRRADWYIGHHGSDKLRSVRHLLLYNSGSVLDDRQFSRQTFVRISDKLFQYCRPDKVSLDTRCQYITEEKLSFVSSVLANVPRVEFVIGLEAFDEQVRIETLKKFVYLDELERCCQLLQPYPGFSLAINLIYALPCWSLNRALDDIRRGVEYCHGLSEQYSLTVNFNIHPFQPNRRSKLLFPGGESPGDEALRCLLHLLMEISSVFPGHRFYLGLNDEGLSREDGRRLSFEMMAEIKEFNRNNGA